MLSRSNYVLGIVLLVAAIGIFAGIGRIAVPRLLDDTSQIAVGFDCDEPPCESAEVVAQLTATELSPTETAQPPTNTPSPTNTATSEPTVEPTTPSTDTASPTATTLPTETTAPTETPAPTATPTESIPTATPSPAGPTATPDAPQFMAVRDAALFAEIGGLGGRTGYYVPATQLAWVIGRSEDARWIHVAHLLGDQGWASANYFEATRAELVALPVSDFVGKGDPNVTVRVTQVAQLQPTNTPRPAFPTPRPSNTPFSSNAPRPTNTPWPTSTPRPRNTPWPTRTPRPNAPRPTSTWVIPTPVPTNTPFPTPISNTGGGGQSSGGATTNAIAWWHADQPSIAANGNGTWRADVIIRVPTSFQYTFDMPFLATTRLRDRNLDGDDFFLLATSGMSCGSSLVAELIARQNGARMMVFNEFTLQQGSVVITAPC